MQFLMLVLVEPIDEIAPGDDDTERWVRDHDGSGVRVLGDVLAPAAQARTVRVRPDGEHVDEGPFAAAHEAIVGFDVLECDSMEHAVSVALDHPMARRGVLELRAFAVEDGEGV